MNEPVSMDWKAFTIRLIEALRWPVAFVVVIYLLQDQIGRVVTWMTGS